MIIALPEVDDPPRHFRLYVPAHAGWLSANARGHWRVHHELTRTYRQLGFVLSRNAKLPRIECAHVVCELRFSDTRRRDPANWAPTAKAVLDGMVDAGIFPDDSSKYIEGPDMRLGPVVDRDTAHLVMHIWPQSS